MELPERFATDLNTRLESDGVIVIVMRATPDGTGCMSQVQMHLSDRRVAMELPEILAQLRVDAQKSLEAHEILGKTDEHED